MSILFNFKDFLTLDEVREYLVDNGYPEFNRDRVITFVKDLINEGKLSVAVYYKGDVGNELLYRDEDKSRVDNPDNTCYINAYSWLDFNTAYALFNSESPIDNNLSSKDIMEGRFNLTPNIKDYKSILDHENEAYHCWTFIENKDYTITLNNVRYYRPDLDELFNNQAQIDDLKEQLSKVSAELATSKTNINEPLDDRSEKSYLNTIGLLLELMTSPRAEGGQAPFPSESDIIARATSSDKSVYGQGKSKLEERFRDAKLILADTRKKS